MKTLENIAIVISLLCVFAGCQHEVVPAKSIVLVQPAPKFENNQAEPLYQFAFGGLYKIIDAQAYEAAARMFRPERNDIFSYSDGAIKISITPVPYGVRLHIHNKLPKSLTLLGERCTMIDVYGQAHITELRQTTTLFPETTPDPQACPIAPDSDCVVDLDAISPAYRGRINRTARSAEERGAFLAADAPLPIFCSGFYTYESNLPDIERVRQWAIGRQFGVSVTLSDPSNEFYEYKFTIEPFRSASGPVEQPDWKSEEPTPINVP